LSRTCTSTIEEEKVGSFSPKLAKPVSIELDETNYHVRRVQKIITNQNSIIEVKEKAEKRTNFVSTVL
jgi:hypothetical protein